MKSRSPTSAASGSTTTGFGSQSAATRCIPTTATQISQRPAGPARSVSAIRSISSTPARMVATPCGLFGKTRPDSQQTHSARGRGPKADRLTPNDRPRMSGKHALEMLFREQRGWLIHVNADFAGECAQAKPLDWLRQRVTPPDQVAEADLARQGFAPRRLVDPERIGSVGLDMAGCTVGGG